MPQNRKSNNFEDLYRQYYAFLSLVSFRIVKDKETAKDIVQDFFVSFWQKKDAIIIETSFVSYACKAVKNMSFRYMEKLKKEISVIQKAVALESGNTVLADSTDNGKIAKIKDLLDQLPERRKHIFLSHVVYGQSYSEIAAANNISINTVKTQMKRAYAFFKTHTTNPKTKREGS